MAEAPPEIASLPDYPVRGEDRTSFATKANNTVAAMPTAVTEMNDLAAWMKATADEVEANALASADASIIGWSFSTETAMADPGSGFVRFDNATLADITAIAISDTNGSSEDISDYIATWDDSSSSQKGVLIIRQSGDGFAIFNLTGLTDNAGWFELAVTHVSSGNTFTADVIAGVTFTANPFDLTDDDTMATVTDTAPASGESVKAYVDNKTAVTDDDTMETVTETVPASGESVKAYVDSQSSTTSVAANGDYTSGTLYLAKSGDIVTVQWENLPHASAAVVESTNGLIPVGYRPIIGVPQVYNMDDELYKCTIDTGGQFSTVYLDWAGGAASLTGSSGGCISYRTGDISVFGALLRLELDATYIYAATNGGNIYQYSLADLNLYEISPNYGGTIRALGLDATHVYAGGETTQTVRKYLLSDMSFVSETDSYGGTIRGLALDSTYLFYAGSLTQTVRKVLKSNLTILEGETADYGGTIWDIIINATHIYAGGQTTKTVQKYLISSMAMVDESPNYGGTIRALALNSTHVFAGGETTQTVRKYLLSDMSFVDETADYGGTVLVIETDATHIYIGGETTQTVRKYAITDLTTLLAESPPYGSNVAAIRTDATYIYVGGYVVGKVKRYLKSDLTFVDESEI
jgi:hypothetical protein